MKDLKTACELIPSDSFPLGKKQNVTSIQYITRSKSLTSIYTNTIPIIYDHFQHPSQHLSRIMTSMSQMAHSYIISTNEIVFSMLPMGLNRRRYQEEARYLY